MQYIENFLNGYIMFDKFHEDLLQNEDVKKEVHALISEEMRNEEHIFWKSRRICIGKYKKYDFDLNKALEEYKFDGSLGDCLNIWGEILRFYKYFHPDFQPQIDYEQLFDLYLDTVGESYGGSEVTLYISNIVKECNKLKTKTAKRMAAKKMIKEAFKLENGKKPYWIQGADWPMGQNGPMTFRYQKKKGELVDYIFIDEDTGIELVITQFY